MSTCDWRTFEEADPNLAAAVRRRFAANRHHVLATIRPSGAPRLSGTEVVIDENVRVGMMPDSHKLRDVQRDPRVEVHSAPLEDDLADGDARMSGRLVGAEKIENPPGFGLVLDIERVSLVRVERDELVVTTWSPERGTRVARRR